MKQNQNNCHSERGITLIALVVTLVVLLILAGITIKFVIGDNGIFEKANYAGLLSEMASVKEAITLYQMTNKDVPVLGNMSFEELNKNKELKQEIGYYRVYSISKTKPDINQDFSGEFMETPEGVADLKYLDNSKLGLNKNEKYLYDNVNKMIYKTKGIKIKGQLVFSDVRAKELTDKKYVVELGQGNAIIPPSPGANRNYKLASMPDNDSVLYKIYNNGDVYAIGEKGILLNTPTSEMNKYRTDLWGSIDFNEVFHEAEKVYIAQGSYNTNTYIYTTKSGETYAIGDNVDNKLGLSNEQLINYTGRDKVKLNIPGNKKVKNAFIGYNTSFIITEDNQLYACGNNTDGRLGIGHTDVISEYTQVNINNVENIRAIHCGTNVENVIIEFNDDTYYFAGRNKFGALGDGSSTTTKYTQFTRIWNNGITDIDQDIKKIINGGTFIMILKKDGTILMANGSTYYNLTDILAGPITNKFSELREEVGKNITNIYYSGGIIIEKEVTSQKKYYAYSRLDSSFVGIGENLQVGEKKLYEIKLPQSLIQEGVKEVQAYSTNTYFISNTGNVYGAGDFNKLGINGKTSNMPYVEKLPISNMKEFYKTGTQYSHTIPYLLANDGKIYTIGNNLLTVGGTSLQLSFTKIASNITETAGSGEGRKIIAYKGKDSNLYVAGENESVLGLNKTTTSPVPQYILNKDVNIAGKVDKVYNSTHMYVLTKDKMLYGTGEFLNNGNNAPGWSEAGPKYNFVKILDNIDGFYTSHRVKIAYNQNSIYLWGRGDGNPVGKIWHLPVEKKLTGELASLQDNIKDVVATYTTSFVITKDGKLWATGNYNGVNLANSYGIFIQVPETAFNNEKVEKVITGYAGGYGGAVIVITEKGNVYGWGKESQYLGIGEDKANINQITPIKLPISNVVDGIATKTSFILTKDNGEIWGTGNNSYGILGRWLTSDGKYATSRYQNAYEWVRCVDLEK